MLRKTKRNLIEGPCTREVVTEMVVSTKEPLRKNFKVEFQRQKILDTETGDGDTISFQIGTQVVMLSPGLAVHGYVDDL